jgi:hypothetical protein
MRGGKFSDFLSNLHDFIVTKTKDITETKKQLKIVRTMIKHYLTEEGMKITVRKSELPNTEGIS